MEQRMDDRERLDRGPGDAELADEWTRPVKGRAVSRGQHSRRLAISTPGAFVAGVLVAALAVGAALRPGGPMDPTGAGGPGRTAAASDDLGSDHLAGGLLGGDQLGQSPEPDPTKDPGVDPTKDPATPEPTKAAEPEPTPTPKPTPVPATPKPTPTPVPAISLALVIKESHPYATWGACEGVTFDAYKVVRSTDSTVSWPAGSGDTLVAAVKAGGSRTAWDSSAPGGKKLYYRVFCVQSTSAGYKAVRSSATKAITTPADPSPPAACSISLSTSLAGAAQTTKMTTGGTGVSLDWTACQSSGLVYYKVVRSATSNPSYLPWTDGTTVVAVVDPSGTTAYVDHPGAGTWYYRVQAIGTLDGSKTVLGQTAAIKVVVP